MALFIDDSIGLAMQDASSSNSGSRSEQQLLTSQAAGDAATEASSALPSPPVSAQPDNLSDNAAEPASLASDLLDPSAPSINSHTAHAAVIDGEMSVTEEQTAVEDAREEQKEEKPREEEKEEAAAAEEPADTTAAGTGADDDAAAPAEEKEANAAPGAAEAETGGAEGDGEGDVVVEEVHEMEEEQVQELFKSSIISLLTDPAAGELSLATVKQHLREQHGKRAVKQHKDVREQQQAAFIRDFVRQEVLRLQAEQAEEARGDDEEAAGQAADDQQQGDADADADAPEEQQDEGDDDEYQQPRAQHAKAARSSSSAPDEEAAAEAHNRADDEEDWQEERRRKKKADGKRRGRGAASSSSGRVGPVPVRSAYLLFSQANRERLRRENADASFGDVSRLLGEQWKELPDDERAEWRERGERDKERWQREMEQLRDRDPERYEEALREGRGKGKGRKKARAESDGEEEEGGGRRKKKKRRRGSDSEGEEDGESKKELSYFDSILARLKTRRQTKSLYDEDDTKEMCRRFLQRMETAYEADAEAVSNEQPAVQQLLMLDEVQQQVGKKEVADRLIDHGLLKVIRKWLQPLADGSLPNIRIRSVLYRMLDSLPITETDLETSGGLGRTCMLLWEHEDETADNRRLLAHMMQKWMRPMLGLKSTYRHLEDVERSRALDIQRRSAALQPTRLPTVDTGRARIPEPANFDYAIRPASLVERDEDEEEERKERLKEGEEGRKQKMIRRLEKMRKTAAAGGGKAKYKVDVSGRNRG